MADDHRDILDTNNVAFKEWASVCDALGDGATLLLLRKGGIDEGEQGFRVAHRQFWFFPTRFHQTQEELIPEAAARIAHSSVLRPVVGQMNIDLYGVVSDVIRISDAASLNALSGLHILSDEAVQSRFAYRQPGLFALVVRVYRRSPPHAVADLPRYAGCHSWVEMETSLLTFPLRPVLDEKEFTARRKEILARLPIPPLNSIEMPRI